MTHENTPTELDLSAWQNTSARARRITARDGVFAIFFIALFVLVGYRTAGLMDIYEKIILVGAAISMVALAWFWRPLQWVFGLTAALSLASLAVYGHDLARGDSAFLLKYALASQPAVMWMSVLFVLGCVAYWVALFAKGDTVGWMASRLTYAGLVMGLLALMVRWHESYLIAPDVGHIPVSNLYEVFIVFALLTTAFYLYYEDHYQTRNLGGFVMLVVMAAVGFMLWYSIARGQHEIKPLIPALQSWWMKIHVPANFVGYGTFSIAAMVGFAYLIKYAGTPWAQLPAALQSADESSHGKLARRVAIAAWVLGALLFVQPLAFRRGMSIDALSTYWAIYMAVGLVVVGIIVWWRRPLAAKIPDFVMLDDIMYKAIAIGFVFFTIATILGAMWAADAWGKYWQWDPKETWALIVWLNYAAWLHLRLMKGMRGIASALWVLVGLLITGFAFLGVNIVLSGLHSYGNL